MCLQKEIFKSLQFKTNEWQSHLGIGLHINGVDLNETKDMLLIFLGM